MRDLLGSSTRTYLNLPWGQVHVRSAGRPTDTPLVLLHQSPLSSATFEAILAPLAEAGIRTYALDTPGFGMSDPTPEQWQIPEYAEAVWQVVDALGLGTVTLLGQHTGAVIAAEAAAQQPGRMNGLILQGLPLYSPEERVEKNQFYAPPYAPDLDGSHLMTIWERIRRLYPESSVDECNRQVLEYLATGPDFGTAYRAVFNHETDSLALAKIPTALIHGQDDLVDRFTDVVVAALPHAHVNVVPGTDFAADEYPQEFAEAVSGWMHSLADPGLGGGHESVDDKNTLYTAVVAVTGGRAGRATSTSGSLALDLSRPATRGTDAGTDPEELFAAGYAACFGSSLEAAARRERIRLGPVTTTAHVSLQATDDQQYSIAVELVVTAPECDQSELERLSEAAHAACPYSKATRGNIPLVRRSVGRA